MPNVTYALLVGINEYPAGVPSLSGCVNDVEHFHDYLKYSVAKEALAVEALRDGEATRANLIRGFRTHLGRARAGDVAVFFYCGHGARSASAAQFAEFYPGGLDEGLVCVDSRLPAGHDLADKELAVLISELARTEAHVAFILDACHTGSATRGADAFSGLVSRRTGGVREERALDSYLDGHYAQLLKKGESLSIPAARHILLAACDRTQEAKESPLERRGVFSATLLEVLEQHGPLSYADLFRRSRAAVRKRAVDQDPQFEPVGQFDAWSGFLGGAGSGHSSRHSVTFDKGDWTIDFGAIHGMPTESDKSVGVVLYNDKDPNRAVGSAMTVEVNAQQSTLALDFPGDEGATYRAAITSLPTAPLLVHCAGEAALFAGLGKALEEDGSIGTALTEAADGAHYAIAVKDGQLALLQRESEVLIQAARFDPQQPQVAGRALRDALRKVAQWERLLALHNRASDLDATTIDFVCSEAVPGADDFVHGGEDITLESVQSGGKWGRIKAKVRVRNRSGRTLNMLLAYFSPAFGVTVMSNDPIESGEAWVTLYGDAPEHVFTLIEGRESEETIDRFKLIVSTKPVDGFLLEQEELELGATVRVTRAIGGLGGAKKKARSDDWMTKSLRIRVVPRLDEIGPQPWTSDNGAIVVKGHSRIKANVSLGTAKPGTRALGEGPAFLEAFERAGLTLPNLSGTRGAGHSVLELSGIANPEALATEPLQIELNLALEPNEGILPFVFDGQHVLLGGDVSRDEQGRTHISIDHLHEAPSDRRSLGGSLKLYFFKTYLKQTSLNKLRWIEFKPDGSWAYRDDGVAAKVGAARRVLLLVHGIIGDTEGMANGVRACGLDQKFDLVLTYDYENLSTPITETAQALKAQLAEAGLQAADDKHLTLLVHSMGGLVSRWFIERQGGREVVDHLVMCGTPNNGSPFGKVDDVRKILDVLVGLAANYVPALIPFSAPILFLLNRSKKVTPTLMQMDAGSDFIRDLNASLDPGVRYTVLAGDVNAYQEPTDAFFAKLLTKTGQSVVFEALFGMKPNDIAVCVDSISRVGGARESDPDTHSVACHHLNYFLSQDGQRTLMSVAW
ncbi:MAG: caspase family protein [Variovorax sp.]